MKKIVFALFLCALTAGSTCFAKQSISLLNGEWQVAEIYGQKNNDSDLMLGFNTKEHRIYGNSGCNTFFALISNASKKKISFGAMGATRMACHKDDNYKYTTAVSETAAYKIGKNNDTLELKNKKGEIVVRLTRTQK
ncbi:MAG: META domain-containing protein [Paludibacteraceae bacterium]|nr:META domain-containing protein [Paludibacteraceae bacterium]MDD6358041.1 META domain-containing protein [Bacteroidales bacterium]